MGYNVAIDGQEKEGKSTVAKRVAKEMGYKKVITYILITENGASLKAAGWLEQGICGGGNWNVKSRPRKDSPNVCKKRLFYKLI